MNEVRGFEKVMIDLLHQKKYYSSKDPVRFSVSFDTITNEKLEALAEDFSMKKTSLVNIAVDAFIEELEQMILTTEDNPESFEIVRKFWTKKEGEK